MSAATYWKSLFLTRFTKPQCDRALYQRVKQTKPTRIVELGVGDLSRASNAIALAQRFSTETIHYCGIDLFEARAELAGPSLKQTHHQLSQTGAQIRLVPGDVFSAVGRTANLLSETDLLIIDATTEQDDLDRVRAFLPRMLHANSSIARYDLAGGQTRLRWMKPSSFLQSEDTTRKAA